MKTAKINARSQTNISWIVLITGGILLIPLVAMQFSDQVKWSLADFTVAAVLLVGIGLAYEFIVKKSRDTRYRLLFASSLLAVFILLWLELAVGIFGTPLGGS